MTFGQPFCGTDNGPALLREAGLLQKLTQLGWRVEDLGDMPIESPLVVKGPKSGENARKSTIVGNFALKLSEVVEERIHASKFPLVLGGDHSVAFGSLAGVLRARPNVGVIWIDAHADLNTPDTSGSGNLHGMPLGFLVRDVGADAKSVPGLEWLEGGTSIPPDSIVYIGLRDVDAGEREVIHR
mmetsp:Transcript_40811/g.95745  ORF Transcript_40811/g.95745 Transcript_40811/m.95745 type:complete len:184 (-) Transcript_40811:465-1016(-)